jgi:S-adenosyl-L-methionine hydrolase (adenosine-forming)
MLFLYSDFGHQGPYAGEMEAAARRIAAKLQLVHLMHDAPAYRPQAAGCLLAALARQFRPGDVCLAVVDPGVGGARFPAAVRAGGCWYVGPDNGLLWPVAAATADAEWWEITWRPEVLSTSFHGRDLFAPFAAQLALGKGPEAVGARPLYDPVQCEPHPAEVIYVDRWGNLISGLQAAELSEKVVIEAGDHQIPNAATFSSVGQGELFWYQNSMGLVEIAANMDDAARKLGLDIGDPVAVR